MSPPPPASGGRASARRRGARIDRVEVSVYTVPTDSVESDGTLEWDSTTLVVVDVSAGGETGQGWSYTSAAAGRLVEETLAPLLQGAHPFDVPRLWSAMVSRVRNMGRQGIAAAAIAAVDVALWDLKARLLGLPLVDLFGQVHDRVPVYGSGGFTSYTTERLQMQLANWAEQGLGMVKMKVGRHPERDPDRVAAAREAIGPEVRLFVDANGAYARKQALLEARRFARYDVRWLEEPVSSDDLEGLRLIRDQGPPGVAIAAGEYGYDLFHPRRLLQGGAVDVLQADATRCCGLTGFLKVGALCEAWGVPLSAHTAPTIHLHACCALPAAVHIEYFFDHVRIGELLFDGFIEPEGGALAPDRSRPGHGARLDRARAARFRA